MHIFEIQKQYMTDYVIKRICSEAQNSSNKKHVGKKPELFQTAHAA